LASALADHGIPSLVIELNADTVHQLHEEKQPALFADSRQQEVWDLAGVQRARLVAFTFPATMEIAPAIQFARERNPSIAILVRTKFSAEAEKLVSMGADLAILDEAESGRAVVRQALGAFNMTNEI
jgi:CPA2 family monovalent cation:H+ antiporter-2